MMKPRLKQYGRRVAAGEIFLLVDVDAGLTLEDPDGRVRALLDLLDGTRTVEQVAEVVSADWPVDVAEVQQALAALDEAGLLEDGAAETKLSPWQQERYASNLEFFGTFTRLGSSRYGYQERLCQSHVVLLGAGGLGSTLLLNLAGMGVGRVTVVDFDRVELKNLARQFLYRERDVGRAKTERAIEVARALNSEIEISAVETRIDHPDAIPPLIAGASLVLSAIDQPGDAQRWVNASCVPLGIPFVFGGFQAARGFYGSVDSRRSGCLACLAASTEDKPLEPAAKVNRGIGPVATLTASLMALEALRYLSAFAPPVAAGKLWVVDYVTGRVEIGAEWDRLPACPTCGGAEPSREPAVAAAEPR
jgi:molybdopterin-synthase adenylyltransferase